MYAKDTSPEKDYIYIKTLIKGFAAIFILMVVIFCAAGRIDYSQGWTLFILILMCIAAGSVMIPNKSDLINERLKSGPGVKRWDNVIIRIIIIPASITLFVLAPLDAARLNWSVPPSQFVYVIGFSLFIASSIISLWAVRTNKYFSSVVRIQADRGQVVVENGPYRFVRHPGYIGIIMMFISLPLILGSLWAFIPAGINVILFIIRTRLEDKMLRGELFGYNAYVKKVPFKLIPGVW